MYNSAFGPLSDICDGALKLGEASYTGVVGVISWRERGEASSERSPNCGERSESHERIGGGCISLQGRRQVGAWGC